MAGFIDYESCMEEILYVVKFENDGSSAVEWEEEFFNILDEAKDFARSVMSRSPEIHKVSVIRNARGECVDSQDYGCIWSWKDEMSDILDNDIANINVFSKGDFEEWGDGYDPDNDPEFDDRDITFETDCVACEHPLDEELAYSNNYETCEYCGTQLDSQDITSEDWENRYVRYTCPKCGNTIDRTMFEVEKHLAEDSMPAWKIPGYYSEYIFDMLDKMPNEHVHRFIYEYEWQNILGINSSDSVYDMCRSIERYLDRESGYSLYSDLDKYCAYNDLLESLAETDEDKNLEEWLPMDSNNIKQKQKLDASDIEYLASRLSMFNENVTDCVYATTNYSNDVWSDSGNYLIEVTVPYAKTKMAYGQSFSHNDIFTNATGKIVREIFNATGYKLFVNKIWTCNENNNIILVSTSDFHFLIDKADLINQLHSGNVVKPSSSSDVSENLSEWISYKNSGPYVLKVRNNPDGYNYEGCGGRSLVRIDSDMLSIFDTYDDALASRFGYNNPKYVEIKLLADEQNIDESCRKPIPEGKTIKDLVEDMEENEDMVECKWCDELFDKSECRYEVNMGWLCPQCIEAIKSRGEELTFKENIQEAYTSEYNENDSFEFSGYDDYDGEFTYYISYPEILEALKELIDDEYVEFFSSENEQYKTVQELIDKGVLDEFLKDEFTTHIHNYSTELNDYFEDSSEYEEAKEESEREYESPEDPDGFYGWDDYYRWKNGM